MTNHWIDVKNADAILIMGSNAAENHPIAFKWVEVARERGAVLISVDPRFTRTSALADIYAPMRSGADIAFLGGMINHVLANNLFQREYVVEYTNAAFLLDPAFGFKDGYFSGWDPAKKTYDRATWKFQLEADGTPKQDKSLKDPNTVFQRLKRHFGRYTPEMVERVCGTPRADFLKVADAFARTGAPDRAGTIMYAMGWTQHSKATQLIRTAAILQLLLGNIGVAGGGVNALRGLSNVQGSTDMALLFHILPGYLGTPTRANHPTLQEYLDKETPKTGYWVNKPKFFVSLLKAWYGEAARKDNEFAYQYLPKNSGNYSHMDLFEAMYAGKIKGFVVTGQNPAVSGPNSSLERKALERLEWLVVRDLFETETAAFWKGPGVDPAKVATEVFLLPSATHLEREGTYTNSGRWLQWKWKAVEPPGDARSDAWFANQLAVRLKKLYADSKAPKDQPVLALTWGYGASDEPDLEKVLAEVNGYTVADGKPVKSFAFLTDDGSTACGNWIYSGVFPAEGQNRAKSRKADPPESLGLNLGWGFSWPVNRRVLYNRASADPRGKPWNGERALIWWDPEGELPGGKKGKWVGKDVPDFRPDLAPEVKGGGNPFIMRADGKGGLWAPLVEGPFPEHYEPVESPVRNLLSPTQSNPLAAIYKADLDRLGDPKDFPIVATTYRLTEHMHTGSITRNLPWLVELMPSLFCEMSRELAAEKGIQNGDPVVVRSARGEVRAVAYVTGRIRPFKLAGRVVHQVGIPWHWGFMGMAKGDSANLLTPHVGDANTRIQESKAFLVDVRKA
ncbi:MAG: formate dehydrogenase-N subunit alpha [Candidatus Rokubacteria bacterium GWA2_73_35]|nr:MAG: formate dehydrogenase-N subunit alpha [Candidatus Rokubacteria bacterium GWA2_73_35]